MSMVTKWEPGVYHLRPMCQVYIVVRKNVFGIIVPIALLLKLLCMGPFLRILRITPEIFILRFLFRYVLSLLYIFYSFFHPLFA
jgi:hypothetical protein